MKYQLVYRYVDMQSLMINIEDVFAQMELKEYSMINARFHQEHAREFSMQVEKR